MLLPTGKTTSLLREREVLVDTATLDRQVHPEAHLPHTRRQATVGRVQATMICNAFID